MKEKEDEKMKTLTVFSSEVITSVKEQLKTIGLTLSFSNYYNCYSVSEYPTPSPISVESSYLSKLIEILKSPGGKLVTTLHLPCRYITKDSSSGLKILLEN